MTATQAAIGAFREAYMSSGDIVSPDYFSSFEARRLRYDILWAFYENTVYRDIHRWAKKLRADYGMYKYTRNVYNPTFRLVNFYQTYLLGGSLDVGEKGAGTSGALPILTANDAIREPIARLWRDSNWQVYKDVLTLHGACLGDAVVRVIDDVEREKVYLKLVHPGTLHDVEVDPFGNVRGYTIVEKRTNPEKDTETVTYTEEAERGDGEAVVYRTYRNGQPYGWDGQPAEWSEPYGFVPLVMVQHNNTGLPWGWSEAHAALSKIREVDDQASKLSDQIRKSVDAKWLFSGVSKPGTAPRATGETATTTRPEPGREEDVALYGPAGASATPLVADLNIEGALKHIDGITVELERDYPELKLMVLIGQESSGKAIELAREPVETKVRQRRVAYDDGIRRAQQMAIAIGGHRNYEGYGGFNLESYQAGKLDHTIGDRPVFSTSAGEKLANEKAFWETAKMAKAAGYDLALWLADQGWSEDRIKAFTGSASYQATAQALKAVGSG